MTASAVETDEKTFDMDDITKHNTASDCWMVLYENVYNFSSYINSHPGGADIIEQYAGKDATAVFATIHSRSLLLSLALPYKIGRVNIKTIKDHHKVIHNDQENKRKLIPSINKFINIYDFEKYSSVILKGTRSYRHIFGGALDEIALKGNCTYFNKIYFRPNVMIDVSNINMKIKLFDEYETSFPLYISAHGLTGLAHPLGEIGCVNACKSEDIFLMLSIFPTKSMQDIYRDCIINNSNVNSINPVLMFQVYMLKDIERMKELIETSVSYNFCRILVISCDHPVLGKRERDMRGYSNNTGIAAKPSQLLSDKLCWNDLKWIKSFTNQLSIKYNIKNGIKLVLKGIQSGWDAINAVKYNLDGIIISNHGGRQLDYTRPSMQVLIEVMNELKKINAVNKIEVYMDGGIRRGSDIFKALAIGAKAVGIGRPSLWGLSCFGEKGVQKVIQILRNELEITMKLMGTPTIDHIRQNIYNKNNMLVINDINSKL